MTTATETRIPTSAAAWTAELNETPRAGWCGWDTVGGTVFEGIQNWSEKAEENGCPIGVWGIVEEVEDAQPEIRFYVYVGDCRDPHAGPFENIESAFSRAESDFSELF
jgi:hypothetical protein